MQFAHLYTYKGRCHIHESSAAAAAAAVTSDSRQSVEHVQSIIDKRHVPP